MSSVVAILHTPSAGRVAPTARPAVTSTTASGRHGVEVAPASRHSAETRRMVCMVRMGSSLVDLTRWERLNPDLGDRDMCQKSLGEAKEPGLGYLESYSRTPHLPSP